MEDTVKSEPQTDSFFVRRFTRRLEEEPGLTVYDLFSYKTVRAQITDKKTGEMIIDMDGLEFPEGYSKNACNIIASKYFRKAGVNGDRDHEHSMKQLADRLVGFWADALADEGIITDRSQWSIFYDELVYALLAQMWAPNSPQFFNTGIKRNYGVAGDSDEHFYYDPATGTVEKSPDRYTRTQASACFIVSIADSLIGPHSISEMFVTETKLFKGGSGVGTNYSTLRAVNESLSSGGVSSGVMSFLKGLDRNAGAIKSGGTTRRAAKMVILDVDHPEIEEFVTWKAREEDKVRALGKMGYDVSMDGDAYSTVSGQNGNNSVRVSGEFMGAVKRLADNPDAVIALRGRKDSSVDKTARVGHLWRLINQSAWECADPAIQFDDTYNAWHTCPAGEDGMDGAAHNRINATNPCSEYAFLNNTSCNLASIDVFRFFDPSTGGIDTDSFRHLVGLCQLVLEASIHWGQFPTPDIARNTHLFRTTGLGIADLASLLLVMGFGYNSEEGRQTAAAICSIMTGQSYLTSALVARKVGAFEAYPQNRRHVLRVLRNHARCARALDGPFEGLGYEPYALDHRILSSMGRPELFEEAAAVWTEALECATAFGVRNAQVSLIAPTGTISFAMDCAATSVEPYYSHVTHKNLAGGGSMEIINPVVGQALANLGYSADAISGILSYMTEKDSSGEFTHVSLASCPLISPQHRSVFETANEITPEGHVMMVAAITPMISGSVSKTVNLPSGATVEDVERINLLSYERGVKAISIYRDGCKAAQPLSSGSGAIRANEDLSSMTYQQLLDYAQGVRQSVPERVRPAGMHLSRTHSAKIGDIELYVTIGFYPDGRLAELFVSTDKEGTVVKGLLASLSKTISNMLQYNVPPREIARLLRNQQFEPAGFVTRHPYIKSASSISDLLSRIIEIETGDYSRCQVKPAGYAPVTESASRAPVRGRDQEPSAAGLAMAAAKGSEKLYGLVCSNCGSSSMFRNGTCNVCSECGTTTGCS